MPDLLEFKNLRIEATSYPPGEPPRDVVLVDGVSVSVAKGKVLGLIGESGAGKSTIGLSAMAFGRGGVRLTGGEILLNGRNIRGMNPAGLRALRGRDGAGLQPVIDAIRQRLGQRRLEQFQFRRTRH